jgi:hypothetical protein
MKIRNVEFPFNPFTAEDAQKLADAMTEFQRRTQQYEATRPQDMEHMAENIRTQCSIMDNLLATLLGEDYDTALGVDIGDLLGMTRLCKEFFAAVNAARQEMETLQQEMQVATEANALPPLARGGDAAGVGEVIDRGSAAHSPAPVNFNAMNREQRRAYVRSLRSGKAGQ